MSRENARTKLVVVHVGRSWGALPCPGVPTSDPSPETRRRIDHADPRRREDGGGDLGDRSASPLPRWRRGGYRKPAFSRSLCAQAGWFFGGTAENDNAASGDSLSFLKKERARAESLNGARVAPLYPHWTTRTLFFFSPRRTDADATGQSPTCRCSDLAGTLSRRSMGTQARSLGPLNSGHCMTHVTARLPPRNRPAKMLVRLRYRGTVISRRTRYGSLPPVSAAFSAVISDHRGSDGVRGTCETARACAPFSFLIDVRNIPFTRVGV